MKNIWVNHLQNQCPKGVSVLWGSQGGSWLMVSNHSLFYEVWQRVSFQYPLDFWRLNATSFPFVTITAKSIPISWFSQLKKLSWSLSLLASMRRCLCRVVQKLRPKKKIGSRLFFQASNFCYYFPSDCSENIIFVNFVYRIWNKYSKIWATNFLS